MSTIMGIGKEYDKTFKISSNLQTTTSQYKVVYLSEEGTVALADTSTADKLVIGINQTYLDENSTECAVRMFGISKAVCAASVSAGDFLRRGADGKVTPVLANGSTLSVASVTGQVTIIGRALQSGSTNTVISVFVNPTLFDESFV